MAASGFVKAGKSSDKSNSHSRLDLKRGSSLPSISKILTAAAGRNVNNVGFGDCLRFDPLSDAAKCVQLSKLLALIFIPILGGWVFSLYSLADNITKKQDLMVASESMLKGISLGRLIYTIQKERDNSILYVSKLGPGTKIFMLQSYKETDMAFESMGAWPHEFTNHELSYFRTKGKIISYINLHRNQVDQKLSEIYDEIKFYSEIVDFLMEWLLDNIRETGFGGIWKSLVVFQKITMCMLDTGIERAYGIMFFAQGNFWNPDYYGYYFRRINRFNYNYRSSSYYSSLVDPLQHDRTEQINITRSVMDFRHVIKHSNLSYDYTSQTKAELYYDNVSFRVDYLLRLQENVSENIITLINDAASGYSNQIIMYAVLAIIVILACPLISYWTEKLTSNIQNYSKLLQKASNELDDEKLRSDDLLHQMIPKAMVSRLKRNREVDSEFFKTSTIMFTSIVNFTGLNIQYKPLDMVKLLNKLYTAIDERIDKYDVYKVETINDTYMVVSGVPIRNGDQHGTEIAYLSLDIIRMLKQDIYMGKLNIPIQLLIGVSTGSVSAGIVGTVMLRYCLFGDTVNIASRMKSYSAPNRTHISESTYRNLKKTGLFQLQNRGTIDIKGKGPMNTFWLVDSFKNSVTDLAHVHDWQLPGETYALSDGSLHSVINEIKQSTPPKKQRKYTTAEGVIPGTSYKRRQSIFNEVKEESDSDQEVVPKSTNVLERGAYDGRSSRTSPSYKQE